MSNISFNGINNLYAPTSNSVQFGRMTREQKQELAPILNDRGVRKLPFSNFILQELDTLERLYFSNVSSAEAELLKLIEDKIKNMAQLKAVTSFLKVSADIDVTTEIVDALQEKLHQLSR